MDWILIIKIICIGGIANVIRETIILFFKVETVYSLEYLALKFKATNFITDALIIHSQIGPNLNFNKNVALKSTINSYITEVYYLTEIHNIIIKFLYDF